MEQLRYIARSGATEGPYLVGDAVDALRIVGFDRRMLLAACRQLLTRQPSVGELWTACSRILLASDSQAEANKVMSELMASNDMDVSRQAQGGSSTLVRANAAGIDGRGRPVALLNVDASYDLKLSASNGGAVWLLIPDGAWLPPAYLGEALKRSVAGDPRGEGPDSGSHNHVQQVECATFTRVISGLSTSSGPDFDGMGLPVPPVAPELLVPSL